MKIATHPIGPGYPCYVIAEIGINHNGDIETACDMIDAAADAGCDAVKFQKRNPALCVPTHQRDVMRDTPWGRMTYIEYKWRIELAEGDYETIDTYCRERGIDWFASVWDLDSLRFLDRFTPVAYKIPSAKLTDHELIRRCIWTGAPVIISTGMSTLAEVDEAMRVVDACGDQTRTQVAWLHTTSAYPCAPEDVHLRCMDSLRTRWPDPWHGTLHEHERIVGYSGHETGLAITLAAVARGASIVERHFTLDRAMWGTDQAASVEPPGMRRLVRDIRVIESAMGEDIKSVRACEEAPRRKLRGT